MGRYGSAARRYERAVALARAQDDRRGVSRLLLRQGMALSALGQCKVALPRLRESEAVRRQLKDDDGVRRAQLALGRCLADTGDTVGALKTLAAVAQHAKGCQRVEALAGLGAMRARTGDTAAARQQYALAARAPCKERATTALLAYNRGRLAQRDGERVTAKSSFQRAAKHYASAQDEAGLSDALFALGQLHAEAGRAAAAGDALRRAGHAAWSASQPRRAAQAFALAAQQLKKAGQSTEAAECRALGRRALPTAAPAEPSAAR